MRRRPRARRARGGRVAPFEERQKAALEIEGRDHRVRLDGAAVGEHEPGDPVLLQPDLARFQAEAELGARLARGPASARPSAPSPPRTGPEPPAPGLRRRSALPARRGIGAAAHEGGGANAPASAGSAPGHRVERAHGPVGRGPGRGRRERKSAARRRRASAARWARAASREVAAASA